MREEAFCPSLIFGFYDAIADATRIRGSYGMHVTLAESSILVNRNTAQIQKNAGD